MMLVGGSDDLTDVTFGQEVKPLKMNCDDRGEA